MMYRHKSNRTKELYGTPIKRSEYEDSIMRSNHREGNRLGREMQLVNRAQKVIMKDLGKETFFLKNKLESDRRTMPLSLYGSRIGSVSPRRQTYAPSMIDQQYKNTWKTQYPFTGPNGIKVEKTKISAGTIVSFDRDIAVVASKNDVNNNADGEDMSSSQSVPLRIKTTSMRLQTPTSFLQPSTRHFATPEDVTRKGDDPLQITVEIKTKDHESEKSITTEMKPAKMKKSSKSTRRSARLNALSLAPTNLFPG
ncbi:hypothetical protein CHS0354_026892 [Potamilus streckersoni]|uniref:Uncharacterized protein n=1 Tax=Potamilus streckersoni TaxID=2493646 RepID=A0AAE0SQ81_9BIVA|nr:hypothetical protein CHS0354_026892 [Potamilus streckersoni]